MSIELIEASEREPKKHPKCKGRIINTPDMYEFECEYESNLTCEDCKYGVGRKDPEAKCNND